MLPIKGIPKGTIIIFYIINHSRKQDIIIEEIASITLNNRIRHMRDKNKIIEYWKELSKKYYIVDCSIYIEELRKSSFIPFIGAGMSVSFKYPTWNGFLKKRIDEIPASDLDEKKKKKRILKKSLKDGNYLEVAEEIDNDLNHGLNEHVRRSFGNKEIPGDAVNYIAHLADFDIKTYVTTNYDPVIETLFSDARNGEKLEIYLPNRLRDTDEIQNAIRDGHECLIKLHGTYDNSSSIEPNHACA